MLPTLTVHRSSSRAKVADGTSGEGEPSDKDREFADAPASFKSELEMRKGGRTDKENNMQTQLIIIDAHLRHVL